MTVVEPSVSALSSVLSSALRLAIFFPEMAKASVTVGKRPSGTLATMIPIEKTRLFQNGLPTIKPVTKKKMPRQRAMALMTLTKWRSSRRMGVSRRTMPSVIPAMCPSSVASPVA
jgi:hypothetical protein